MKNMKEKVIRLLESELGAWLDRNESLVERAIPEESKIFPLLCGSIVEGFLSKGSDLDFSLVIDDRIRRPRLRGEFSGEYSTFINQLEKKVKRYGIDHMCSMSYRPRTITYLLQFKKVKNPQFRVNYFLFGELIYPKAKKRSIRKRLASLRDLQEFKRELLGEYRKRYGYKLFKVTASVLKKPEKYSPKRVFREIQLAINTFIMAYGLEGMKIIEKDLLEKFVEISKSTLTKDARKIIEPIIEDAFQRLRELKERGKQSSFKRRRLKFYKNKGMISDDELSKLKFITTYLYEYVYEPLLNFYEIQVKLVEVLRDEFNVDIQWLGIRKDHAYIAFRNHEKVKCLDIIPEGDSKFGVYVLVKGGIREDLAKRGVKRLVEIEHAIGTLNLPCKVHVPTTKLRGRVHFKLFSVRRDEDVNELKMKIAHAGVF